jgi:hypothetical protein
MVMVTLKEWVPPVVPEAGGAMAIFSALVGAANHSEVPVTITRMSASAILDALFFSPFISASLKLGLSLSSPLA